MWLFHQGIVGGIYGQMFSLGELSIQQGVVLIELLQFLHKCRSHFLLKVPPICLKCTLQSPLSRLPLQKLIQCFLALKRVTRSQFLYSISQSSGHQLILLITLVLHNHPQGIFEIPLGNIHQHQKHQGIEAIRTQLQRRCHLLSLFCPTTVDQSQGRDGTDKILNCRAKLPLPSINRAEIKISRVVEVVDGEGQTDILPSLRREAEVEVDEGTVAEGDRRGLEPDGLVESKQGLFKLVLVEEERGCLEGLLWLHATEYKIIS